MQTDNKKSIFNLVTNKEVTDTPLLQLLFKEEGKEDLFSEEDPSVMIFFDMSKIKEYQFMEIFENVKPTLIIDLRRVPRFDIGQLNRKKVFRLFKKYNSHYIESSNIMDFGDISESFDSFKKLYRALEQITKGEKIFGPIAILTQHIRQDAKYTRFLPNLIPPPNHSGWNVYSIPYK